MFALAAGLSVLVALLTQLQGLAVTLLRAYAGERLTLHFRSLLFGHAQRLSHVYHEAKGSYDAVFRIQYDSPSIQWVALDGLIPLVTATLKVAGMVYVTARIDGRLALVAVAVSPAPVLLSRVYRRRMKRQYEAIKGLESGAFGVVQEVLSAVRVVKAFGREDHERRRYLLRANEGLRAKMGAAVSEGALGLLINLTTALGTAAVLLLGAARVRSGALSLGDLLVVMTYLAQLYGPLQTVGKTAATLQASLASARRAFELLDRHPEVAERPHARPLHRAAGAVEFRRVSFAYDPAHPVLRDVSFAVPAGARIGIAWRTGAGKSTLVSLVMRFVDPTDAPADRPRPLGRPPRASAGLHDRHELGRRGVRRRVRRRDLHLEQAPRIPQADRPAAPDDRPPELAMILPDLEQVPVYDAINLAIPDGSAPGTPQNLTAQNTRVVAFLCPSDSDRLASTAGHNNYVGNNGSGTVTNGASPSGVICGMVGIGSPYFPSYTVRLQDVTDGLSNTAAYSERVMGLGLNDDAQGADNLSPPGSVLKVASLPSDPDQAASLCGATDPHASGATMAGLYSFGSFWHLGTMYGTRYNHIPPNMWSCAVDHTDNDGAHTAASRHPGAVNVLFADGSVKAIKGTVSRVVWRALGTRTGGEVVSASDF